MKCTSSRITLLGLAALLLTFSACDLTSLNENPNQPTEATTPNLLSSAEVNLADTYWGTFPVGYFGNPYAQYWTHNQYTDETRYGYPAFRPASLNGMWASYYYVLNDLQEIIRINESDPEAAGAYGSSANQIAIAKILQSWTFQVITDIWGPVPFTAALQGRTEGDFSPAYSSQEEIYVGIIDSLTAASDMIVVEDEEGNPSVALGSGDLIYGGNMLQWKKLANSVKMRAAIRIADVMPGLAETAIEEALAAGALESNEDNALIPFNTAPPYQNPIYTNYEVSGRDDWGVTDVLLGVMNENEDPRRSAYARETEDGFVGFPFGLDNGAAAARFQAGPFSRPSERVSLDPTAPAIIMLHDEVLFIMAEAAQRWGIGEQSAEQYYEDAITASMEYWGVTDQAAIDGYIGRVPYQDDNFQTLGTQKWLALYMQGVQGWSEWRRLNFGVLQPPADGTSIDFGRDIAVRLPYPSDEVNLNGANVEEAVGILGGEDNQGTLLWWDVGN